jgi:hypothetical protein
MIHVRRHKDILEVRHCREDVKKKEEKKRSDDVEKEEGRFCLSLERAPLWVP